MDMANKKAGKDILEDILTGYNDHLVGGLYKLKKIITQNAWPKPAKKKKPLKKKRPQQQGIKKKTTHYLSEDVFEDLGEARDTLNNMLPEEARPHISKSGIVDAALKMILQELAEKREDSVLFKQIIKDQKDK